MTSNLPEAQVREWSPTIRVSEQVTSGAKIAPFAERARAGYVAPAIRFDPPSAMNVAGRHFAVQTRERGLIEDSIHTLGRHEWHQLFWGIERTTLHATYEASPIIVGTSGYRSYYHWTLESAAAIVVRRLLEGTPGPFVVPRLTERWQADLRRLFAIDDPLIEVARDEMAVFDEAVLTNIAGRSYSFAPHPTVLDAFARQEMPRPPEPLPPRIYVSRADVPGRRRMENEEALCQLLAAHGFSIVNAGSLPVDRQVALFRHAEVIVAPHGGALTNLIYTGDGKNGPTVIELLQESYLGRSFLKIAQAKRLSYTTLINPDVHRADYHHDGTWRCDLDLLMQTLAEAMA